MADTDALEQAARAALDTFEAEGQWYPALAFTSIIDADDDQVFCDEDAAYIAAASPDMILRLIAAVREADAPSPHTRIVLVAEDADTLFFGRDDAGNRLTFEWGEPDQQGRYTPVVTAHPDDNPVRNAHAVREAAVKFRDEWMAATTAPLPLHSMADALERVDAARTALFAALSPTEEQNGGR